MEASGLERMQRDGEPINEAGQGMMCSGRGSSRIGLRREGFDRSADDGTREDESFFFSLFS